MFEWSMLEDMPRRESPLQSEMLQGTLDMLVLQTLVLGPAHGHTIAHGIEHGSGVFEISPLDPLTFIVAPLLLGMAVMVASYLPARRATSLSPADVLKA